MKDDEIRAIVLEAIETGAFDGKRVVAHQVRGWWKDTGKPEDLLEANRLVLSQIKRDIRGELVDSRADGAVVIEPGARIAESTIRGPAHIAAGAVVEQGYVGPYTSVGAGAKVVHSEIEYSILMNEAELLHLPQRMDASVIGQGVVVDGRGLGARKHTVQLVLGDYSQVKL